MLHEGITLPLPISHLCENYLPLLISHLCEFHMCRCINCNGDISLHAWLKIANQNGQWHGCDVLLQFVWCAHAYSYNLYCAQRLLQGFSGFLGVVLFIMSLVLLFINRWWQSLCVGHEYKRLYSPVCWWGLCTWNGYCNITQWAIYCYRVSPI